jgi:hypothetical protein
MSQELYGKWYVYRCSLGDPVLKAPETTLEITGQTSAGCLARFELSGWAEPVEVEMVFSEDGDCDWRSKEGGRFDYLDFRWARIEHEEYEEPALLMGQVLDKDNPLTLRDFFIAVRSRRTNRLPDQQNYQLGRIYYTPYGRSEPSREWHSGLKLRLSKEESEIEFADSIYKGRGDRYQGGLLLDGRNTDGGDYRIKMWVLPVLEPGKLGHLLAIGYHESHGGLSAASNPHCQGGTGVC